MNFSVDWYTRMGNAQHTGYVKEVFTPPLKVVWKFERGDYVWSGPIIVKDAIYVTGSHLYRLDIETGTLVWQSETLNAGGLNSPVVSNDTIFVAGDEYLFGINIKDGKTILRLEGGIRDASPCVHEGMVYWAGLRGKLFAADISSGTIKWVYEIERKRKLTKFTPVSRDKSIFCASTGRVYALEALTGKLQWIHKFEDELLDAFDTAAIYKNKLLVPYPETGIITFDINNGTILWQSDQLSHTAPSVAEGMVYFANAAGVYAISIEDGKTIWANSDYKSTRSAPIVVGDYLFMGGDTDRKIYSFNRHTGEKVWEHPTGDLVYSTPAYAYGRLVIGSHDGYVYCFEQA